MATNEMTVEGNESGAHVTAKVPFVQLVFAVITAVSVAMGVVGGGIFWLVRSGRLPLPTVPTAETKVEAAAPVATHEMVLEPLVVNLADAGGKAYLRVALTLRVVDADDKKDTKAKDETSQDAKNNGEAAVRDTLLTVLGQETADTLLAADGKQHAKAELKDALADHASEIKVADIFFTEFLVQR